MRKVVVIFLLCLVILSLFGVQRETLGSAPPSVDSLEMGDILFVDIYEGWCHGGYWDHLALYVGGQNFGGGAVIEATYNGGVCLTSLDLFFERDKPAQISGRRLREIPERQEVIQQVIDYALDQIGKPFDYTATATLPAKINEKNLHCTEVIWRAYKSAGIDLDSNGGLFLYPDDIYFSSKLKPI